MGKRLNHSPRAVGLFLSHYWFASGLWRSRFEMPAFLGPFHLLLLHLLVQTKLNQQVQMTRALEFDFCWRYFWLKRKWNIKGQMLKTKVLFSAICMIYLFMLLDWCILAWQNCIIMIVFLVAAFYWPPNPGAAAAASFIQQVFGN